MRFRIHQVGQFEQLALTALMELGGEAYDLQIFTKRCELSGKQVNLGGMYVSHLVRLKVKT